MDLNFHQPLVLNNSLGVYLVTFKGETKGDIDLL